MASKIFVLNGSNLNRLGTRQPEIYGTETLASVAQRCTERAAALGLELDFRQTNFEGEMVESVHDAIDNGAGIIMNPAGFTFQSVPLMDALKMFDGPKIEVHISNVHQRDDPIYHHSMMSKVVTAVIAGMGTDGYLHALDWMANQVKRT
ncbi:MAG: type II 3-dehydroquinate dehydratase [Burkholderiaceae bacterium]